MKQRARSKNKKRYILFDTYFKAYITLLRKEFFYLLSNIGVLQKKYKLDINKIPIEDISNKTIYHHTESTNNLFSISSVGGRTWFRPIHKHKKFRDFIIESIQRYCTDFPLTNGEKEVILNSYGKVKNRILLYFIGVKNNNYSLLNISLRSNNPHLIGIEKECFSYGLKQFAEAIWSDVYNYRLNSNSYHTFNITRALCEEAICKRLSPDTELLCYSKIVKIKIEDEIVIGSLQKAADGITVNEINEKNRDRIITKHIQRDLNILHVLDAICYERDHRPDNYNVVIDAEEKGVSIRAFDNDSTFAFLPVPTINFPTFVGGQPLVDRYGLLTISSLDASFANRLLNIRGKELADICKPYLTFVQRMSLIARLLQIQRALKRTINAVPHFLDSEPSTLEKEILGKYGWTYTYILYNWHEILKDYKNKHRIKTESY